MVRAIAQVDHFLQVMIAQPPVATPFHYLIHSTEVD
jgi:hypothetical protein